MYSFAARLKLRRFLRKRSAWSTIQMYGEELPLLAACDYVFERAGPRLLGLDIASIASAESRHQIAGILDDPDLHDRLVVHMLRGESYYGDAVGETENGLAEFRIGLMDWPGP